MNASELKAEEGKGFLDFQNKKEEEARRSTPCWKTRRFIYCVSCVLGSILAVFLAGLIMYFVRLHSGTFNNEEGKDWEARLLKDGRAGNFSGMYELVRYDDQYQNYLVALGIPYLVVQLILVAPEILVFDVPSQMEKDEWTLTTKAGPSDEVTTFKLDEPFIISMRKGKTQLNTTASMTSNDTLSMDSISLKSGNNLISSFAFSASGLINTRVFVPENITTKKYYKRTNEETLEAEKEPSPFSDSLDDDDFLDFD
eukprot:TRINITY_DN3095_c0_g1_i2.p1 TRINITY_DN3095_c0_g1~~TRINITY_DN3095_c0_g1_i2.p1  ORF type:complete len:255 (-),score=70.85 TRINITY_DN3095_c0_g1_i2:1394-2158(-)